MPKSSITVILVKGTLRKVPRHAHWKRSFLSNFITTPTPLNTITITSAQSSHVALIRSIRPTCETKREFQTSHFTGVVEIHYRTAWSNPEEKPWWEITLTLTPKTGRIEQECEDLLQGLQVVLRPIEKYWHGDNQRTYLHRVARGDTYHYEATFDDVEMSKEFAFELREVWEYRFL